MTQGGGRRLKWLAIVLGGATVFQSLGFTSAGGAGAGGCQRFYTNGLLSSIDFSYLLDFNNGFFGGLVQPCNDPGSDPFFLDCSNYVAEGETTTGTTTETTTTTTE